MFPRGQRLPKAAFRIPGKRRASDNFSIALLAPPARGYAVVVPKKTARLSVARHRLKRRIVAALRGLPLPHALVVYPRASAAALTVGQMREELAALVAGSRFARRSSTIQP